VGTHYIAGMLRIVRFARHQPSAILLAVQLASLLVFPFIEDTPVGRALFSTVGIVVLALAVWSVANSPAWTWVSLVLAGPATVLLVVQAVTESQTLVPWVEGLLAALYFYAAGALVAYMLADRVITRDELYAVGATFALVAWAFAHLYTWCQAVYPDSFVAALNADSPRSWMELLFLSFTTLSSTGLSDVVPVKPFARSVVMIEQFAGMLYVAMVVARMVGLTFARIARSDSGGTRPPASVQRPSQAESSPDANHG